MADDICVVSTEIVPMKLIWLALQSTVVAVVRDCDSHSFCQPDLLLDTKLIAKFHTARKPHGSVRVSARVQL